jgi:hypothetical protein
MDFDSVHINDEVNNIFIGVRLKQYIIAYDLDINKTYYFNNKILTLFDKINDFKFYIFKLDKKQIKKNHFINLLNKFIECCINTYTFIPVNYNITDDIKFIKITYKKYFSKFLPYIPIIVVNKMHNLSNQHEIIKIKDKFLGILIDNNIIPMIIIAMIIKNYILNNSELYIIPQDIKYNIGEIKTEDDNTQYVLIPKDKNKFSNNHYINKNDYIYEVNQNKFNKMGFIFLEEINSSVHINTYMLLKSNENINIKYTPNIFIKNIGEFTNLPIKITTLKIDKFNSDKLKIPINVQPIIKFRDKIFTILSEELIKKNNYYDLSIDLDTYNNYYSTNNFVILIENNKLLIVNKISSKNIINMDTFVSITSKILSKNKRKFEIDNDDNLNTPRYIYI